jgi:heme/copper-type cytochrome/quinol oxidase subunit 4
MTIFGVLVTVISVAIVIGSLWVLSVMASEFRH